MKHRIFIDADACPTQVREIIVRAAHRTQRDTTFVANHPIPITRTDYLRFIQVVSGFDEADNLIAEQAKTGDLVITQDIPLAADVIASGAEVLHPRGQRLDKDNIQAKLDMRNFMENMRSSGVHTGGPAKLSNQDIQTFANKLDRWLAKTEL